MFVVCKNGGNEFNGNSDPPNQLAFGFYYDVVSCRFFFDGEE